MESRKLVDVINHPRSVVELYLSDDATQVIEVKCMSGNQVKEYCTPVEHFLKRKEVPRRLKNKLALALVR